MAECSEEMKASVFLPMDLDISWVEEDDLQPLPQFESSRLSMESRLDMDFKRLAHRMDNTSTPFIPRPILSKSPVMCNTTHDSGYDGEISTISATDSSIRLSFESDNSQCGFFPISAARSHRERLSLDSEGLPGDDVCLDLELDDDTSSISSLNSKTKTDLATSPASSYDSQAMDMVFQALDLNSSGYSSMDSSRYCSQQDLEIITDVTPLASSDSESSQASQVSVVEMVCVKLEKELPMFSRAILDRLIGRKMGLSRVDIIGELHARNMTTPLSLVFSFLSVEDLTRVCCVSRQWRQSVMDDAQARHRRQQYVRHQKILKCIEKENRRIKTRLNRGLIKRKEPCALIETQSSAPTKEAPMTHCSDKFTLFVEEASKLCADESLRQCPRCQHPARVHRVQERARCTNTKCANDFCLKCLSKYHGSKDCPNMVGTSPVKSKKSRTETKIGSRKSKRNLQRL